MSPADVRDKIGDRAWPRHRVRRRSSGNQNGCTRQFSMSGLWCECHNVCGPKASIVPSPPICSPLRPSHLGSFLCYFVSQLLTSLGNLNMAHIVVSTVALLAMMLGLCGCGVKHNVYRVAGPSATTSDGVYYWLPQTVIEAHVEIVRIQVHPGPLADQLASLARDPDVGELVASLPTPSEPKFKVGNVSLKSRARPDPNAVFVIKLKASPLHKRNLKLRLNEFGIISDGASSADDKTLEFALKTFEVASSVGAKWTGMQTASEVPNVMSKSALAKAMLLRVKDIQARRIMLLSSTQVGDVSTPTLERMLMELAAIEEECLGKFRTVEVMRWVAVKEIVLCPDDMRPVFRLPLLTIETSGVTAESINNDVPEEFKASSSGTGAVAVECVFSYDVSPAHSCPVKMGQRLGFVYRVPASVRAQIRVKGTTAVEQRISVSQLGGMIALPTGTGALSSSYDVSFVEGTGALKSLTIDSSPPNTGSIESVGKGISSIAEGVEADRKVRALAEDDLARLERQRKILEEQVRIRGLERQLLGASP